MFGGFIFLLFFFLLHLSVGDAAYSPLIYLCPSGSPSIILSDLSLSLLCCFITSHTHTLHFPPLPLYILAFLPPLAIYLSAEWEDSVGTDVDATSAAA